MFIYLLAHASVNVLGVMMSDLGYVLLTGMGVMNLIDESACIHALPPKPTVHMIDRLQASKHPHRRSAAIMLKCVTVCIGH
jgi:hypothetical protein